MIRLLIGRTLRQLWLVPIVAIAAYALMAALPMPTEDEAKRQLSSELVQSYRADLGLGEPLGFLRPWQKMFRGERLGTSAQGVTFDELVVKLSGSVSVGLCGLAMALFWAAAYAVLRVQRARGAKAVGAVLPALAFGTPAFIPALLLAPMVAERGHLLPELAAALVVSVWPGVLLGTLCAEALHQELNSEYARTALAKGLRPRTVLAMHVLPNVLPVLLDSLPPVATSLLAGSFAAERILGLPYFGQLYVGAVLHKQVAVVVVATTMFAALLVAVTLGVQVLRLVVDPRSREGD